MALNVSLEEIVGAGHPLVAIKSHWKRVRLGAVGRVLNGFAFKSNLFSRDDGMPLVRIRDVGKHATDTFYVGEFDERYVIEEGDLLVGMDGDFNCARWRGPRALLNQRVCKISIDSTAYLPRFVDYVLPGYLKAINEATSSITVKHLSSRTVEDIPLPLPPMAEQQAIAAELDKQFSRLEEAVATLQRVKANLKRYKSSVLKAAAEGRLVETEASVACREGRRYESGEQILQRLLTLRRSGWHKKMGYKEPESVSVGAVLPKGWAWATVEQLNPVNRPCAYGVLQPGDDQRGGVPFVRVGDVADGQIELAQMKRIHADVAAAYPRTKLVGGEVLLTLVGAIGRTAVVPPALAGGNVARAVGVLPISPLVDAHWVEIWFRNPVKIAEMTGKSHEVARKTLNLEDVRLAAVALPPLVEQHRIVAEVDRRLSIVREVEAEVDANLRRAQGLRQAILAKAFSGAHA